MVTYILCFALLLSSITLLFGARKVRKLNDLISEQQKELIVLKILTKEQEAKKETKEQDSDKKPSRWKFEVYYDDPETYAKIEELSLSLLDGTLRLADVPYELRILSDWPYCMALRYNSRTSKKRCLEDLELLKSDLEHTDDANRGLGFDEHLIEKYESCIFMMFK